MEYRSLGRTGAKVSPLCLGCMMFGGKTDEVPSMDIIDRAIDAGINFLDTANVYSRGRSEEVVGKALKRNGKRAQIVLATKVHGTMADDDPNAQGNNRRHIIEQCDASLRRLQTDYIDLYQIHRPSSQEPMDETLRALDDLIRAGKVRYIGTSTYAAWQVLESLWMSKELGLNRMVCEQPPYHLLDRRIERELVPLAQTYGLALLPWSPLAGGFLTGKYSRGEARAEGRFKDDSEWNQKHFTDAAFDVLDVVQAIAQEKDCSASQFALAWCAQQPGITSPIVGPRTMEQLEDNLCAVDMTVTDADRKRIDEVAAPGRATVPYYDADFGPHQFRW
ncbi:MAG: aldo/keto reductase [Herpetosiphonaceae bacterium]|nr:aldo/keto reductase [Herpetosiphonaceae bacterium]